MRVGVCSVLLWIMYFFTKEKAVIHRTDIKRFFLCALTGIALNQLLSLKGLSLTFSIHASLLALISPILITVIAAFLLKERLNNYKAIGLLLGIAGSMVLIFFKDGGGDANNVLLGDILIIANSVFYAIYFILVKPLMKTYSAVTVIRMIFTIGFFIILPFCWQQFTEVPWQQYTSIDYFNIGMVVLNGTFFAYLFNVYGIKVLGASVAGTYIYSQPVFAAIIAMIFLGEALTTYKILAAILIITGVYFANKTSNKNG